MRLQPSPRLVTALAALGVVVAGLLVSCAQGPAFWKARTRVPRIVFVTFDTFNVRYATPYGAGAGVTPALEELAREGTVFDWAHTAVPLTLPSHTAMMSGLSPVTTGVMVNGDKVPQDVTTLAEVLQEAGYRTGAFVSLGVMSSRFGLDQGFETYDDAFDSEPRRGYRVAEEIYDAAAAWVKERADEPFFLWVHFSDPHEPYVHVDAPPDTEILLDGERLATAALALRATHTLDLELPPGRHQLTWRRLRPGRAFRLNLEIKNPNILEPLLRSPLPRGNVVLDPELVLELENTSDQVLSVSLQFWGDRSHVPRRRIRRDYVGRVKYADAVFGRLRRTFGELGLGSRTLWVVASDHGEGLLFHGAGGHSRHVWQDQLRILWMMAGPGVEAGHRVAAPVAAEDLFPTLLDHLGIPAPASTDGASRARCLEGKAQGNGNTQGNTCEGDPELWAYGVDPATGEPSAYAGYEWPYKWLWPEGVERPGRAFDLPADPWERQDLWGRENGSEGEGGPEELERLRRSTAAWARAVEQRFEDRGQAAPDEETREILRSLGYLGS